MSLARIKTWSAEVLTHIDLNGEFDNILSNPIALISPVTANINMAGYTLSESVYKHTPVAFVASDTTPSVAGGTVFKTANVAATTITAFDSGVDGQPIWVFFNDVVTTIDFTGTTLIGNGGADWHPTLGASLQAVWTGTQWLCQTSDRVAGTDTIASATTCDIGSKLAAVLALTGTSTITGFGSSMSAGSTKILRIASAGLTITPSANMILGTGYEEIALVVTNRTYLSEANDTLTVTCLASGQYFVGVTRNNALAPASNDIIGARQNLEVVVDPSAPESKVKLQNCSQLVLGRNADLVTVGNVTAKTIRLTNMTTLTADLIVSGLGGLDTGSITANTDYWLWVVSTGTAHSMMWSLSPAFPIMPAGYVYAACICWNHTNGASQLYKFQKVNHTTYYVGSQNNIPIVASGSNAGVATAISMAAYFSPQGTGECIFTLLSATALKVVSISPNSTAPRLEYQLVQHATTAMTIRSTVTLMLEGAYIWYTSDDVAGEVRLVGFVDTI